MNLNTYKIYILRILLILNTLFVFNCATDYYSRSYQSTDADQYISVSNEYYPEAEANFQKKISQNGKSVILESGNLLIPKNEKEKRVLTIELKEDLIASATDKFIANFQAEKSNVLYLIGFDVPRVYRESKIFQNKSQGYSDQVEIDLKQGVFEFLSEKDEIRIQLNQENNYKLSSNTIDLYQIQLDQEVILFHWKLKKLKGDLYSVESTQKYTGKLGIHNIHRDRLKYITTKSLFYIGKTFTIFIDIVTFPIQLPYWILYFIGVSSGAR